MDPKEYHTQVLMCIDGNPNQQELDKWIADNGRFVELCRVDGYSPEECATQIEIKLTTLLQTIHDTFNIKEAAKAQATFCKNKEYPHFAPHDGKCWSCHNNIYSVISVEIASLSLITGCPICHRSYCD